jgi:CRISPR/Cas system-associated exonuclease Cas4 (RecB family)
MNLSYSLIKTYQTCPLQYRYSYVDRLPRAPRGNLQLAKKVHVALRRYYLYAEYGPPEFQRIAEAYSEAWNVRSNPDVLNDPAYTDGLQVIKGYYEAQKDLIQRPVMLEQRFELHLGAHRFVGKVDRVDLTQSGGLEVVDYKMDRVMPDPSTVENDLQMGIYLLAVEDMQGRTPDAASRYYLRHNKKIEVTKTSDEIERVGQEVMELADKIDTDRVYEPQPGKSCGSCSYRKVCPAVSSNRTTTADPWTAGQMAAVDAMYVTPELPGL